MGNKRRLDKVEKIADPNIKKVTLCKRKRSLIKKAIELSIMCQQTIFIYILDKRTQRMVHYSSDESENLVTLFNQEAKREFYTNVDYKKFGVQTEDQNIQLLAKR